MTDSYGKLTRLIDESPIDKIGNRTKSEQQSHFTNSSWERVLTEVKVIRRMLPVPLLPMKPSVGFDQ